MNDSWKAFVWDLPGEMGRYTFMVTKKPKEFSIEMWLNIKGACTPVYPGDFAGLYDAVYIYVKDGWTITFQDYMDGVFK